MEGSVVKNETYCYAQCGGNRPTFVARASRMDPLLAHGHICKMFMSVYLLTYFHWRPTQALSLAVARVPLKNCVQFLSILFNSSKTGIREIIYIFWALNDPPGLQGLKVGRLQEREGSGERKREGGDED